MCLRRHFTIRVCKVAIKWNAGKPLLQLNGFPYLNFNNKTWEHENKVNSIILDYEIVLGLHISEKLHKASVLHVL